MSKSAESSPKHSPTKFFGSPNQLQELSPTDLDNLQGLGVKAAVAAMEDLKQHITTPLLAEQEKFASKLEKNLKFNLLNYAQEQKVSYNRFKLYKSKVVIPKELSNFEIKK